MKLIIDIPKDVYEDILKHSTEIQAEGYVIAGAVLHGTPPSVESKGEWIPVSERLPEERQSVLVWCPERRNIYCACLEKQQWWIFGAFMKVQDEVVAWMPLPKPYKAEKGGDKDGR